MLFLFYVVAFFEGMFKSKVVNQIYFDTNYMHTVCFTLFFCKNRKSCFTYIEKVIIFA